MEDDLAVISLLDECGGARGKILVVIAQDAKQDVGIQLVGGDTGHGSILPRLAPAYGEACLFLLPWIEGFVTLQFAEEGHDIRERPHGDGALLGNGHAEFAFDAELEGSADMDSKGELTFAGDGNVFMDLLSHINSLHFVK